MSITRNDTLEYRLFLMTCLISMFVSFVFFIINTFISKAYDSATISALSFFNFSIFYYQVKYKNRFQKMLLPFMLILVIIANSAWFTGGGLNISNLFIFFLVLLLIIIISPLSYRSFFLVLIFLNLVVLNALEFLYPI